MNKPSVSTSPNVVIVILNWNKWRLSLACIESLRVLEYQAWQLILVDNGSTDGSTANFSNLPENAELITLPTNRGYTGGNNVAIARAMEMGAKYIWLLNNDAKVEKETLSRLVSLAETNPRIGLAGPVLMHPGYPPDCEAAGVRFDCSQGVLEVTTDCKRSSEWQCTKPDSIAVFGTGLLLRRELIEKIGGFDDKFFAYDEDVDLSIRSVGAGFVNVVAFDAILWHAPRDANDTNPDLVSPHVHYYMTRNEFLLWRKHCGPRVAFKAQYWALSRSLSQVVKLRNEKRGSDVVEALLRGAWDGLRGKGGAYLPGLRVPEPFRSGMLMLGKIL